VNSRSAAGSRLSAARSVTFDVALRSAPRPASTSSTAARLDAAANIAGVSPLTDSFAFTSAPLSMSSVTAAALPDAAANMSGVVPFDVRALTSAFDAISRRRISRRPADAACINGVMPWLSF